MSATTRSSIRNTKTGQVTYGYITADHHDGTVDFTYDANGRLGEQTRRIAVSKLSAR